MPNERAVLCGDVPGGNIPFGGDDPLRLRMWGPRWNVQLQIANIHEYMKRPVPPAFLDLIEIATYVYCADQATTRGGSDVEKFGENWRRRLFLRIPVRNPDLWRSSKILEPLRSTLSFLSEDEYHFEFTDLRNAPPLQKYLFTTDSSGQKERPEEVILFSGGLDSLGGAIQEAICDRRRVVLVTHRPTSKLTKRNDKLKALIEQKAAHKPIHLPININKAKELGREYTQRSRSFLYASLGATIAQMFELSRIRFYENGVVSLNLPVSAQVVGSRATRTTHPQVINGFAAVLSAVADRKFNVENPFLWKTKTEILQHISQGGCEEMVKYSTSCTHTWEMTRLHTHCGICSQCIDRRFAVLAAGLEGHDPAEAYKVGLLLDPRADGEPRTMLASYVETASEIARMSPADFFSRYGEASRVLKHLNGSADTTALQLFELHQRHAKQVTKVVDDAIAKNASAIRNRTLPPTCLLRLVSDSSTAIDAGASTAKKSKDAINPFSGDYVFVRKGQPWIVKFAGGQDFILLPSKGTAYLDILISGSGTTFSAADLAYRVAKAPQKYALNEAIDATSPETLGIYRARYRDLEEDLEEARKNSDLAAEQRTQNEMDQLKEQIKKDTGLGGRIRKIGDDRERVRKRVCIAIRRTLDEIAKYDKRLAEHLNPKTTPRSLTLGQSISYVAPAGVRWNA
ncbi:MAG: 7-cyano-7-deazaguanine synthase [Planctomycetota bacterium]